MKRLPAGAIFAAALTVFAQQNQNASKNQTSGEATAAAVDRLIAEGKSPHDLARYVFDTHGYKSCHTIRTDGKLGYTEKGKERAAGFEGCIRMLTAMTVIV